MINKKVCFDASSVYAEYDIANCLNQRFLGKVPIVICLGSDKILSDMVGVFVAEILKKANIKTLVFGGFDRPILSSQVEFIKNKYKKNDFLFVDSGAISQQCTNILFDSSGIKTASGNFFSGASIVAGTIYCDNNKFFLAKTKYKKVLGFANVIANGILKYFSYANILYNKYII